MNNEAKHSFSGNSINCPRTLLKLPALIILGISTSICGCQSPLVNRPQTQQLAKSNVVAATATANIKSSPNQLLFAGSGSNLEILRLLAKEFKKSQPKIKIDIPASIGSTGAIQAAADGAITVGLISRPLKEQEKKLGLTVVPYAQTATVIAAHPTVADKGITSAELIQIYKGTKTRWHGGQEIIVLTREEGDSSITVLKKNIPEFKDVFAESNRAKRWTTLYKDQEMNRVLVTTPYAIGLADLGTVTAERLLPSIKVMNFNSVSPTLENVASGKYRLIKTLAFVYQEVPPSAKAFLNFIQSPEGKKLLKANGYLPVG